MVCGWSLWGVLFLLIAFIKLLEKRKFQKDQKYLEQIKKEYEMTEMVNNYKNVKNTNVIPLYEDHKKKDFLQKEVVPHIEKWESSGSIDRFIWEKFGGMGYFGLSTPESYDGLDLDLFYTVIFTHKF